ncbi:hypothetical protein BJ170DRAFT_457110 [Xylariales sp. AK1849]|nr:hypothetical protein BJ170DRAFT_457110 [Xylariales sp. AK1849]
MFLRFLTNLVIVLLDRLFKFHSTLLTSITNLPIYLAIFANLIYISLNHASRVGTQLLSVLRQLLHDSLSILITFAPVALEGVVRLCTRMSFAILHFPLFQLLARLASNLHEDITYLRASPFGPTAANHWLGAISNGGGLLLFPLVPFLLYHQVASGLSHLKRQPQTFTAIRIPRDGTPHLVKLTTRRQGRWWVPGLLMSFIARHEWLGEVPDFSRLETFSEADKDFHLAQKTSVPFPRSQLSSDVQNPEYIELGHYVVWCIGREAGPISAGDMRDDMQRQLELSDEFFIGWFVRRWYKTLRRPSIAQYLDMNDALLKGFGSYGIDMEKMFNSSRGAVFMDSWDKEIQR